MKRSYARIALIVLLGVIVGVVVFYKSTSDQASSAPSQENAKETKHSNDIEESEHNHSHSNVAHPDVDPSAPKPVALSGEDREKFIEDSLSAVTKEERESLLGLTDIMSSFTLDEGHGGITSLVNSLKEKKLSPYLMKDENPYTGTLSIVRTKSTLPGTRYFHAQVFKDEQGRDFIQHVSFEFRPGPSSFDAVKAALMKEFNITTAPTIEKKGFAAWSVGPYSVSVKEQTLEDFKNDPFNAHDKSDVGTVRGTAELEIHDHEAPIEHVPADEVAP